PGKVDRFLEICEKWDVIATVIAAVFVCPDSRRRPLVYATDAAQARGPARRNSPDPLLTWEIAAPTA
ncbi:hypothetical protein AB0R01_16435, partial [Streptomyces rochei]|uniref:hypothetical protein n=1 Tax=Streptomyces rochei TaxID=1928 RepID=UPI003419E977